MHYELLVFEVKRQTFGLPKYQFRKRSLRYGRRFKLPRNQKNLEFLEI